MDSFPVDLASLSLEHNPSLFTDVGFCVSGKVDPKITKLLENGGAKSRIFVGVGTTHFIAGADADEMKIDEAKDIFEVPVVSPRWAVFSAKLGKVLPVDGFGGHSKQLFSSLIVTTSGINGPDLRSLWAMVTFYGGQFQRKLTSRCTHLISNSCSSNKYKIAKDKRLKIVCSDWIIECIKNDIVLDELRFDPQLIIQPQTSKGDFKALNEKSEGDVPNKAIPVSRPTALNIPGPITTNQYSIVRPHAQAPLPNMVPNQLLAQGQGQRSMTPSNTAPRLPLLNMGQIHQPPQQQHQINSQNLTNLPLQSHPMQSQMQNLPVSHPIQNQPVTHHLLNQPIPQQIQNLQVPQQHQPTPQQMQNPNQPVPQQMQNQNQPVSQQNQPAPQQIQNPAIPHQLQNQPVAQQIQNQPGPQPITSQPGPQQIQNQTGPQQVQNPPGSQQMQNPPGPQQMQNPPGPQQMQNQPGLQQMQNQPGPQQMQNPPGPQQMQNQPGPQQIQNQPGPQQMQNQPGPQQIQNPPVPQQMQNQPGPQQIQNQPGPQQIQNQPGLQQMQHQSGPQQIQNQPVPQQMQNQPGLQQMQNQPVSQQIQNQTVLQQMQNQPILQQMQNQPIPQQMQNQTSPQQITNQSVPQQMQIQPVPQHLLNQSPQRMQNQGVLQQVQVQSAQMRLLKLQGNQEQQLINMSQSSQQQIQMQGAKQFHPSQQLMQIQTSQHQQLIQIQNQGSQQQMPNVSSQQQIINSQQLLQKQVPSQMLQSQNPQQIIQNQGSHQHMQNQSPHQQHIQTHSQVLHSQMTQQPLTTPGSQQVIQGQVPQQIQNQGPQQGLLQNQISQQIQNQMSQQQIQNQISMHQMQNQSPQQMHQSPISQQQLQQNQSPQQLRQSPISQQQMQNQSPQQMRQSPISQQQMQTQSPQQMRQSPISQQQIQNQSPQQMRQSPISQQQMQSLSPQQMHSSPIPQQQIQSPQQLLQNQLSQQQTQNQGSQQMIQNQPLTQQLQGQIHQQQHQFQQHQMQGQIQYQNQNLQQMQFQAQSPMKTQSPQPFGQMQQQQQQHMISSPQQVRLALQSPQPQNQQQIHFQVVQQSPNRPQIMMGQMQPRGQFQQVPNNPQNILTTNIAVNQQNMFRQQQPQNQVQLFHPIQQQRMQSQSVQGLQGGQQIQIQQQLPNQLQGQLQPTHLNQGQMQPNQIQQGQQHYNVVINQPFPANAAALSPVHQQPNQQLQPPQQQQHVIQQQKVQFQTRVNSQFTQQQQMEIIRQIQLDPQIKQQWARMDNQSRALLVQKLAQRNREEHLRREMMLRQQQLNQQNSTSQQQTTQGTSSPNQQQTAMSNCPQSPHLVQSSSVMGVQNQTMVLQQSPMTNHLGQPEKQLNQGSPQGHTSGNQTAPMTSPQQGQQVQTAMGPQQQILLQGHPDAQKTNASLVLPNQVLIQNHQIHPQNQQKVINPQSSPVIPQQKFLAPAPVQTRPQSHGIIGSPQQSQQTSGVVRTQQIFTPQVGQQQQQRVNVRHVLVHPGQQTRPQVLLQQQISPQQKAILQAQQQNQPLQQSNNQWQATSPRMMSPGKGKPNQFQPRLPTTPEQQPTSPHLWNVRPPTQAPQSPSGSPSNVSYVQVVNSKTKTALANLLSNRLQGNTGPESNAASASTSLTSTTSTSQTMCPPPPPPVTSQSLPQSAPATTQSNILIQRRTLANITNGSKTIQVNSFGAARVAVSQASPTLPVNPPRPSFYGHDPQLKLPPDSFFIGCTFWAAEEPEYKDWDITVVKYGGSISDTYSAANVTHVLCKTQKFPEFLQVVRDGKRVITCYWLSDICIRKIMLPPFYAIHLPVSFASEDKPMTDHVLSLTGFQGDDRQRAKSMCKIVGSEMTGYFTQFNTGLVACKPEGSKYQKAREWKKPVVSIQFLNEVILGHSTSLQMIHSPKYQNFNVDQPFRFDIALAPHLMAAWKIPIRVNSEVFEKYKSLKRPLKSDGEEQLRKRLKLESEIDNEPLSPTSKIKTEPDIKMEILESKISPVVLISGFTRVFKLKLQAKIEALGGKVTSDYKEATHLVLKENFVTVKLFIAISHMNFIVNHTWITDSLAANKFVDEQQFIIRHKPFEDQYGLHVADVLTKPGRQFLFKGLRFFITPGLHKRSKEIECVIEAAGGILEKKQRSLKIMRDVCSRSPKRFVIITCDYDYNLMENYFLQARRPHLINIFTDTFIWYCIATQKVKFRQAA